MKETKEFPVRNPRDALSLMSQKFYEKYGDEALPLIRDVWYKLGTAIGKKMKSNIDNPNLATAGQDFVDSGRKRGTPIDIVQLTEDIFHIKGHRCALGLGGKGIDLCRACMGCDLGILEAATGSKLNMDIIQSLANNDDCCEVMIRK
ncbi:MAG: hypothetical protein DRH24_04950 [Deltaproteobacteria bacterium]|nr:MAG: hypothetical protein DRH24_04950 [Deltaproteobacteria bacterium]